MTDTTPLCDPAQPHLTTFEMVVVMWGCAFFWASSPDVVQ